MSAQTCSGAGLTVAREGAAHWGALTSSMCTMARCISSGINGGLASNDPSVAIRSKNEPCEPNGPSTSANAEQYCANLQEHIRMQRAQACARCGEDSRRLLRPSLLDRATYGRGNRTARSTMKRGQSGGDVSCRAQ